MTSAGAPNPDDGTYGDFYINTNNGDFYEKDFGGTWNAIYNFATGGGGGLIDIENESTPGFFKTIVGSTAFFKGLEGNLGEIFVDGSDADTVILSMEPNYVPPLLERLVGTRKIGSDTFAPPPTADINAGYEIADLWSQKGAFGSLYFCTNNAAGAATWIKIAPYSGSNLGTGAQILKTVNDNSFQFRTIVGSADQISPSIFGDELLLSMDDNYKPITLDLVPNIKNNYTGTGIIIFNIRH